MLHNTCMGYHLVRYSLLGQVGRFVSSDGVRYPRNARVIVRSPRGLEIGEVLSAPELTDNTADTEGEILRRVTVEDDLLIARLEKHHHEAFTACCDLLAEHDVPAVLVDVEHLSPEVVDPERGERRPDGLNLRQRVDALELELVTMALERTAGNQTRAAELLGVSRFGLQKMMKRLDILPEVGKGRPVRTH